ncbi:hypothetical protein BD0010_08820 [Helicobacter pylori]
MYLNNFVKVAQKNLIFTICADVLTTILSIALFFLMVFIILSKSIGVGAIAGYIQAFSSTQQQLQDLSFYGKWFFTINKYFENYFYILDYKTPKPETQIKLEEKSIALHLKMLVSLILIQNLFLKILISLYALIKFMH